MKHIFEFAKYKGYTKFNADVIALYAEPTFLKNTQNHIFDTYPPEFKRKWSNVSELLNSKYEDCFLVPLDLKMITVGCLIKLECEKKVQKITSDIYREYSAVGTNFNLEMKVVYSKGRMNYIDDESVHKCIGPVMDHLGPSMDKITDGGIYKV